MASRRLVELPGAASTDLVVHQPRWAASAMAAVAPRLLVNVRTGRRAVALTFDDGPDDVVTPALLDVLARHRAQATFFLTGERIAGRRGIVQQIVAGGHELGNHLMHAAPTVRQSRTDFERDLLRCHRLLRQSGNVRYFRPASGWIRPGQLAVARRHGYRCVLGSVALLREPVTHPALAAGSLLRRIRPGAIVVLHEGSVQRTPVVETVERLLTDLTLRDYRTLTVSGLAALAEQDG
jgi:peptidoglycan/xylan/chitin deacetylase (PgdA/CDA1 family)